MSAPMNEFDLEQAIDDAWHAFAERLGDVVSVMDQGGSLTVGAIATEKPGQVPFVRFGCRADRSILAEASGNAVLAEAFQLEPAKLQLLDDLGWEAPALDRDFPRLNHSFVMPQEASQAIADRAVATLRGVFAVPHPAFLAPDQLAEVLAPQLPRELPTPDHADQDAVAISASSLSALSALVAAELADALGHEPLRDPDGDFALRVGSAMVFVRCTPDTREVIVFSPLVQDIEGRSRAMEVLSDLNTQVRFVRFLLIRDRVFASISLLAQPFVPAHLRQALDAMTRVADELDDQLALKLKGRTFFAGRD
ncbi:MAG: hypothetical protein WCF12_13055 [Propionicimonas sp.]